MENKPNTVKAIPSSPVYCVFDLIEVEGKQMIKGSLGFKDQFGMERMAQCAGEKGIMDVGKHVVAIFAHQIDIIEPDEETKAAILAQETALAKQGVADGTIKPEGKIEG